MNIQAIIFEADKWDTKNARGWVKGQGFKPIKKVHVTDNYIRFRLKEPDKTKTYKTIIYGRYIKAIIEV